MLSAGKAGLRKAGIKAGEEILVSYVSYDAEAGLDRIRDTGHGVHCADQNRRGKVSGKAERRWSVTRLELDYRRD